MVLRKEMSKMIKKIILVILALATIYFIGDTNLKGNSVYYAKHSPSSNVRDLELMMLIDNLDILPKSQAEGIRYDFDGMHLIGKKNIYLSDITIDNEYLYNKNRVSYYFDKTMKLVRIIDFDNNMKNLDTTIVDEIKLKDEIYEEFRPILEELENNEPSINLQWIFNWVYRDRIK